MFFDTIKLLKINEFTKQIGDYFSRRFPFFTIFSNAFYPELAFVTIITDGYENDSIEWDGASVKKLIDRLRKNGWVFTYIGANQDAALEAGKIGVRNSLTFEATIEGTAKMFAFEKQSRQRWNKRVRLNEENIQNAYFSDDDK